MLDFIHIRIVDIVDIFLVALLLYYFYKLIKGTVAINIFIGIAILYLIWLLTRSLQMKLLSELLGKFLGLGVLALIIVFQQEIRRFLLMIGSTKIGNSGNFINKFGFGQQTKDITPVDEIIKAIKKFSKTKTGALIIIQRNSNLDFLKDSGDKMDIVINTPILESIFYKNSPLHDGAVIVEDNKITATRTVLPISGDLKLPETYGLRHRAAVSITNSTDSLALVVSEENGKISYIKNGKFIPFKTLDELLQIIKYDLK